MRGYTVTGLLLVFASLLFSHVALWAHDLVDLQKFNPAICVDLRYAGCNNFIGRPIYPCPCNCIYIERYVATRLGRVQRDLAKEGLGLIVLEGYRPPSVQCLLDLNRCADCREHFGNDACHYRKGLGVDVMVYYLEGQPIKIPSHYQDNTLRAYRDYIYLSANEYHNSWILEKYMTIHGFVPQREKWWHFDLKGWESAPDLNVEIEELMCW